MDKPLSLADLAAMELKGRCFLHEQGRYTGRDFVSGFELETDRWDMQVRDIERYDSANRTWAADRASDEYCSTVGPYDAATINAEGIISLSGYGMVVHIAPAGQGWSQVNWPETDGYPGGPM